MPAKGFRSGSSSQALKVHDRRDSFRVDNSSGTIRLLLNGEDRRHPGKERYIVLPRIGAVRLQEKPIRRKKGVVKTYFPKGRIRHATVSREADPWFVSLTVEEAIPDPLPPRGPATGIDAGLKSFTAQVDETGTVRKTDAPRPLRLALKRLRRLQRKRSRRGVRDEK